MKFISDFHIHSHYSRATAKNLNLENLHIAAQLKGIAVVSTGDFTHPEWLTELKNKLVYDESGLFRLKPEIAKECDKQVPPSCRSRVSFMLVTEISNIYKKNNKTRKNHNLLFVPDLDAAASLGAKLSAIGNIKSDGRPILGLDAKNLLEILLETTERGFFVPAHIWTPWFSLLGSKSGFDSVRECFEDLTSHIYAVETGLSSDPPMNWRVSELENLTLISNSDAHSPANLGREANIFDTDLTYDSIIEAMKSGNPDHFLGTMEFYPEEGKYHYDGHRKCEISFHPEQTLSHNNICPVCEKPLTLGVLYRVNALSDRPEGVTPPKSHPYDHIIPLTDILSEIFRVGSRTKKVLQKYRSITEKLGPELNVLNALSLEKIEKAGIPLLSESIGRMREKKIKIAPGYDGEFGRVKIFEEGERESLMSKKPLFHMPVKKATLKKKKSIQKLQ
jgi:DNA helicase II / ATP-dependent DNA helicase PcrA